MRAALLILAAGAGAIAYKLMCERRATEEKKDLKSDLTTWEAEGGNVPQVPTVSPAVTPESSVPDGPRH
jgi:hypothetical protein